VSGNDNNSGKSGINPAWQGILNAVPPEFHPVLIPQLQEWDKGIQQKFTEIHSSYDELKAFKPLVENNIDPEYAQQAVMLADQLQREPQKVVDQVNKAWNLGYVSKEEAEKLGQSASQNGADESDLFGDDPDDDIFKDPRVKAMKDALDSIQTEFQTTKQKEEEEQALQEFEDYLDNLEKQYTDPNREGGPLPFHRTFVTALISQGIDGEAAVKQYHELLASSAPVTETNQSPVDNTNQPPVVMGGDGSTGSGTPDGSVPFGSLSKNDLNSTVEQLLAQAQQSGQ
jgi:hypothetical protein